MKLFTSGLTGMLFVLSISLATYILWSSIWPYLLLCILLGITATLAVYLVALRKHYLGLIASHPVETAGRVPVTALNAYGRTVDSIARDHEWQRAYEQALLIAHYAGGSFSFETMRPHIAESPRAYWEWTKAELERVKPIERTPTGYRLADDYRAIRAKWHGGILPRPLPHPDRPAPMLRL